MTTATKEFREVKSSQLVLNFHPGQSRTWKSERRIIAMLAGSQGGKTVFGPHWMHREIQRCGEGDYLVGTATFPLLNLKLLPEYRLVFCELLKWGKYAERNGTHMITSHDGKSRIIFFSATNPESIESATAKAAHLDEAGQKQFRSDTWEAVNRRLAIHQGRILITTTLYTLGWLKTEVYDRWVNGDTNIDVIQFDSIANPAYPLSEYERARETLPKWKFAMFNQGRFEIPAGLVHDSFGPDDIVNSFEVPKSWLIYVGHDFGIANPAALFVAQNPDTGELFYYHEYLPGSGLSAADHVNAWKDLTKGYNVIARIGGNHAEQESRDLYTAHGWHIIEPRRMTVEEQVMRVIGQERLHKIKIMRHLKHLIDEKQTYSYVLNDKYEPTDKLEDDTPYHMLAAERYLHTYFTPETAEPPAKPRVKNHY